MSIRLRPPRHRVDPRAVAYWRISALLWSIPLPLVLVILAIVIPPARFWLLLPAVVIAVVEALYVVIMPTWRYRVHRWEATEDAIYTKAGWIWEEWRIAPLSRVQTVDSERGPLQRRFGLSSVKVTTASAAGAIEIEGLEKDVAADLVEHLTAATAAHTGDAT